MCKIINVENEKKMRHRRLVGVGSHGVMTDGLEHMRKWLREMNRIACGEEIWWKENHSDLFFICFFI